MCPLFEATCMRSKFTQVKTKYNKNLEDIIRKKKKKCFFTVTSVFWKVKKGEKIPKIEAFSPYNMHVDVKILYTFSVERMQQLSVIYQV